MYIFIVNPVAGNGRGLKKYQQIITDKRLEHIVVDTYFTEFTGHAEMLTKHILASDRESNQKHWVVFGGDGTLHEVVNGIGNEMISLSFVGGGSGNDFARGMKIPPHIEDLIEHIFFKKTTHPYYLGKYNNRNFINCIGFGFDAVVAMYVNHSTWKSRLNRLKLGKITYIMHLIKQLFTYQPVQLEVIVDERTYYFNECFLLTVNNHPYFGGGMKINPTARNNRHTYHCIVIDQIPKWKVLFLFSTVFTGSHLKFKQVSLLEGSNITIKSKSNVVFQADGETDVTNYCSILSEKMSIELIGSQID